MKNNRKFSFISAFWILLIFSTTSFAGTGATDDGYGSVLKVIIAVTAFLIAFVLWLVLVYAESNDAKGEKVITPFSKFIHSITQSVSVKDEDEILLDHDFDGIKELDNKIPPWWNALFYGAIIFGIIYMINYHIIGDGNVQENEYNQEMETAALQLELLSQSGALISAETVTILSNEVSLLAGKDIFVKSCAACHGMGGEGLVGPNFTDDYWIHGGGIKDMYRIITDGVPAKGMISWKSQLSPNQIQEVASYIRTLRGTNPPNQKGPEGKKWDFSQEETGSGIDLSDKGVGPVSSVTLSEIDDALVSSGKELFETKCSACHKVEKRFVGPAIRGVIERRSPEWIMNMILDPEKMVKENKIAKELLAEYLSPMANQSLTKDEARAVLEYFRTLTTKK
ncbi:MAG: c-type cytochrome [Melioribacteraceae bacterium]|nr:c-type cytochrome [Melioribacteraceae bacterium]